VAAGDDGLYSIQAENILTLGKHFRNRVPGTGAMIV
jgi:hypothetical protein